MPKYRGTQYFSLPIEFEVEAENGDGAACLAREQKPDIPFSLYHNHTAVYEVMEDGTERRVDFCDNCGKEIVGESYYYEYTSSDDMDELCKECAIEYGIPEAFDEKEEGEE